MTEADWLACAEPLPMLAHLRGRASDRKLRLFACACVRKVWHLLTDPRSRLAVETAERFADGLAGGGKLAGVRRGAREAARSAGPPGEGGWLAARYAVWVSERHLRPGAFPVAARCYGVNYPASMGDLPAFEAAVKAELANGARLLRCIIGNPFRPPPALDPACLAWGNGVARRLAASIYEQRAFDRLGILADALEEAGCADTTLLGHCRAPGEHGRGCWVVDAVLEK